MQVTKHLQKNAYLFYDNTMEWEVAATAVWVDTNVSSNAAGTNQAAADQGQKVSDSKPKDEGAAMRYQISRERDMRIKAEKERSELEKRIKTPEPTFDDDSDPTGEKLIEYKIQKGIEEKMKSYVKDLGLDETLEKIEYERAQETFFKSIDEVMPQFKALGIEAPSKQELQNTLETIDKKGITREQLILLSKSEHVLGLLKPKWFSPWQWGRTQQPGAAKSQEEINAEIFARHKVFGYQ